MDDHDITSFFDDIHDAGQFTGPGTVEATATPQLLAHRRAGGVADWVDAVVTALRDAMREDHQPPVARAVLQTSGSVLATEAEPCCATEWFLDELRQRAAQMPDVWLALAIPDTAPSRVSAWDWNPANRALSTEVTEMRWFVEVRGRRMGLRDGKLVRTGRVTLDHQPCAVTAPDDPDPELMRLGRRVLRGHPVRRR